MPGTSRQSPLFGDTPYDRAHRDDDLYDSATGKIIILCFVSGSRTLAKPKTLLKRAVHGKPRVNLDRFGKREWVCEWPFRYKGSISFDVVNLEGKF